MKNLMEKIKQNKVLAGVIITGFVFLVIAVVFLINSGKKSQEIQQTSEDEMTLEDLQESEVVPTVDSNVKVDLTAQNYNREVVLEVEGIPAETESIEYELSYYANGDLPKGALGNIDLTNEKVKDSIKRTITLGTCSSGACVYDEGVESVKVTLKFNGSYGARLFEKEYEL